MRAEHFYENNLRFKMISEPVLPEKIYSTKINITAYSQNKQIAIILIDSSSKKSFLNPFSLSQWERIIANLKLQSDKVRESWNNSEITLATFYSPVSWNEYKDGSIEKKNVINNNKDSLRAQVRDFLAWYKANKGKK